MLLNKSNKLLHEIFESTPNANWTVVGRPGAGMSTPFYYVFDCEPPSKKLVSGITRPMDINKNLNLNPFILSEEQSKLIPCLVGPQANINQQKGAEE